MILSIEDFGVIAGIVITPIAPIYYQVFRNTLKLSKIEQKQDDCKYCQE